MAREQLSIEPPAERIEVDTSLQLPVAVVDDDGKPRSQVAILTDIGRNHYLFHDAGGDAYASVGGAAYPVESGSYRELLSRDYYGLTGRGANRNSLADAVNTLAAVARFDGPKERVFLRVGNQEGSVVIDRGDGARGGYVVTATGWTAVSSLPLHFRRSGKPAALPEAGEADFARIWRYVNVSEEHRVLVAGWMLGAFLPAGPFPILKLVAEQGAGKSSASRFLKALTDPSEVALRAPPRDENDLFVAARSSRVLVLDNLSGLDPRFADALCRLSTGGAVPRRKLYTDGDEVAVELQRPVILNGIDELAARPDLADRCVHVSLPPIQVRTTEKDLRAGFEKDAPSIIAALLNGLSLALRDAGEIDFRPLPRMADFAQWAAAGMPALGFTSEEFIEAYSKNQAESIEAGLDSSAIAQALRAFMDGREEWTGTARDLLQRLEEGGAARCVPVQSVATEPARADQRPYPFGACSAACRHRLDGASHKDSADAHRVQEGESSVTSVTGVTARGRS